MTQDAQVCHGLIPVVPISKILAGFDQPQRQQHRHDRQARHLSCADIEDKYRRKIVTRGGNGRASAAGHRDLTSIMFVCITGPENKPMKRTWTIIGVADMARSFNWYRSLFGQPESAPAHDYFGQILDEDGTVLICLHKWGDHEHPTLTSPDRAEPGNGLLLFFRVDDFDEALARARAIVGQLAAGPQTNLATGTREFALRDPDGYYVMVNAL